MRKISGLATAVAAALVAFSAGAQEVKIGVTGGFTGPNAAISAPYRQAIEAWVGGLGGLPVRWIILDDANDPTTAVKNARKFVDEDKVDAIIGSMSTPSALAMFDTANESRTVMLAMAPVPLAPERRAFIFNPVQPAALMVSALVADMKRAGTKSVGFIGFSDGWGDLNWNALQPLARDAGIQITGGERYNRTDTSVTAQALKLISGNPAAIFVGASSTPAVLPHVTLRDQGFRGPIYHTHGSVSKAFLDNGGKAVEGALMPTGPLVVAEDLPDDNPIKKVALDFTAKFEGKYGKGTRNPFAGYSWDAVLLLDAAVAEARKTAQPGTAEFRVALRDAMQSGREVVGTHAVYRMTATDHVGMDERARVLVTVKDGQYRLYRP